jgi:hypothetical protein
MSTDSLPSPNRFAVITLLICALRCAVAFAAPISVLEYPLGEMTSNPGESLPAFLARVGEQLRAFSDRTGFEACAALATDGTRYGVELHSNHSHIACVINAQRLPAGMHATGESIHSHPQDTQTYLLSAVDAKLAGVPNPMTPTRIKPDPTAAFSKWDYANGPGYLATPTGIIHQHGPGTDQRISGGTP